jgi:hypothetical protein
MSPAQFGESLWGTGPEDAQRRLNEITRQELEHIGLTLELARKWRDFYMIQTQRQRGLPTSSIRVQLLEKCLELLG